MGNRTHNSVDMPHEGIKAAWEAFIATGDVPEGSLRQEILESWRRCRALGLDPYTETNPDPVNVPGAESMIRQKDFLIRAARPFLESLFNLIRDWGMVVYLTDENALVLDVLGEGSIWEYTKMHKIMVGSILDECVMGTNAPCMALKMDAPYQMFGEEHYLKGCHLASCAAAPIHDETGRVIGCLDITSSCESALKHPHTLGMIAAGAQVIENQLKLMKELNHSHVTRQYLRAAIEAMTTGIVILDDRDRINHMNRAAETFLGIHAESASGRAIGGVVSNSAVLSALAERKFIRDCEMTLQETRPANRCLVTVTPIIDYPSKKTGSILILKELKEIQTLMKKVVGLDAHYTFDGIWGESTGLLKTIELAKRVSRSFSNVIITGESGTGKEMLAQSIHNLGPLRQGPFLGVNCTAVPADLIESELFGYETGTFTGALKSGKPGRFELARGGTLLLDEVNGMSLAMQAKLLRVLEEKRFQRLGGKNFIPLKARVIAATNKNLKDEVKKGNFRSDLFFRLNVIEIRLPPLRERPGDVTLLVERFIGEISTRLEKRVMGISRDALDYLEKQPWPGNVRELKNWVERAVTLTDKSILTVEDFRQEEGAGNAETASAPPSGKERAPAVRLKEVELEAIKAVLDECRGNISQAALKLGISRATLHRKLNRHALSVRKVVS
ncbi:MAG: sigma-54-dependent Fis family transcriptional regulator [Syntrophales bacterium]